MVISAEPGVGEPGLLEPGSITTLPTMLIRRPVLSVKINGIEQTQVLDVTCNFGFDQHYATADVSFRGLTGGLDLAYWMPIEITMGASSVTAVPRFYGYVLPVENTSWVPGGTLRCRGPLGVAGLLGNEDDEEIILDTLYGTDFSYLLLTGTVNKVVGSPNIVGTGTLFTTELAVGMVIDITTPDPDSTTANPKPDLHDPGRVVTITDNTHVTLDVGMQRSGTARPVSRAGRTDQEIVDAVLRYYGLTSRYIYTLPLGAPSDTIQGSGVYLGNNNALFEKFDPLIWKRGQAGLDFIEGIDAASARLVSGTAGTSSALWGSYRTFETVGGSAGPTIYRRLITGNPQGTIAEAAFAMNEGVDWLRDLQVTHDPSQVANRINVTGCDDGIGFPAFFGVQNASAYLPGFMPNAPTLTYPVVAREVSYPLLERGPRSEVGDGWCCQDKADQLLQEMNTEVVNVQGSTYRDDLFGPGQTIYVYAPNRCGVFQNMWLQRLTIHMSKDRVFRQQLNLIVKN